MPLNDLKDSLLAITSRVYHHNPPQTAMYPYIVWGEDTQADSVWADGEMQEQAIQGTVDYFTKKENDPNVRMIQEALNSVVSFRLNSVQREPDTELIHFEWVFEVDEWQP